MCETTRKSSLCVKITVFVVICFFYLPAQAKYGGGTGEPNDPYLIYTAEHMNAIGADPCDWDKHFKLMADIDLSAFTGTSFNIIGCWTKSLKKPFIGVFDGNGHTISNFTWNSTDYETHIGLFVSLRVGGHIKDLVMEDVNVNAADSSYVGSLVGANTGGTIQDCYASGSVTASYSVGGLVGLNYKSGSTEGTIKGCHSATNVSGYNSVGGLAGANYYGTITDCNSTGTITGNRYVGGLVGMLEGYTGSGIINACSSTANVSGKHDIGGLVGRNGGLITDCCATGSVEGWWATGGLVGGNTQYNTISDCYSTATVSGSYFTGGLVGSNGGKITNCYSASSVYGASRYFAGLVGLNGGSITACYSTGPVSGTADFSGGLVGENEYGTISNCYSTSTVNANDYVGGLVGYNPDGIIINSYCSGEVTGNLYEGGLLGVGGGTINCFWDIETSSQPSSNGGMGKTTAELQTASTYFGWNSCGEIIWTIDEGNDYPRLLWEGTSGQVLPEYQLSDFLEGNGTPEEPYLIYTAEQLNLLGLFVCEWDKHFLLVNDIDLSQYSGTEFNLIGNPCQSFEGVFDGNHRTIQNFTWTSSERDYIGLFRYLNNGQIINLAMENVDVNAANGDYVGGLAAYNDGTITDSYAMGIFSGETFVGGLVGRNGNKIMNCYSTGSVAGSEVIGGLMGFNTGIVSNCYAEGSVLGNESVGGLLGFNEWGIISYCFSTSNINGQKSVSGLVGYNGEDGTILNCYSTGSVMGDENVGGLVGYNYLNGNITNCYSSGSVLGDWLVGGLVGYNRHGNVSASFWDIETSGQTISDGGTGKTTAEMQMMSTFTDAGWDFVDEIVNGTEDIWWILKGDYPHLWWEGMEVAMKLTPGTLNCRSKGGWVKAHFVLPADLTVEDVDSDTLGRIDSLGIEADFMDVFVDEDGLVRVEMAFDRKALCEGLTGGGSVEITVRGFLTNGHYFYGSETIKIK